MTKQWQTGSPPNGELVEVKCASGKVIKARAIWGCDGVLPHWETEDRSTLYSPCAFTEWRRREAK